MDNITDIITEYEEENIYFLEYVKELIKKYEKNESLTIDEWDVLCEAKLKGIHIPVKLI